VTAGSKQPEYTFDLSGGALSLDLANTVSRRNTPELRKDHLTSYEDLIAFAQQAKLISPREATELRRMSQRKRSEADKVLRRTLDFREALYRAFSAVAARKPVSPADLDQINGLAVEASTHRKLVRANGTYEWTWRWNDATAPWRMLWPMAQSAAELLTSGEPSIVHECEAPDCDWLFLDRSRNHSRRWCDMKSCGNREKARRHYHRSVE
jgi:predicted RNA-binding Zn ribbon-like protein